MSMHPGPMIKLATLLMTHSLPQPPSYAMQFIMTGPPSQFNRLMVAPTINGPWVQINQPDGSFGRRVGGDYVLPNTTSMNPTLFFTLLPAP